MSRARKAREAVIPRDEDFARWRKLIEKSVHPKHDLDKLGRKLWGHADETRRVYACSADHTIHIRSFVRLRPLLESQRKCNGAAGELPAIECCADGRTVRFARDPSIPEDEEKRIQEEEAHGNSPGHTASLYAYSSCSLYHHRTNQDQMFSGFVPQALNAVLYGGLGCLVVYGEKGSGKTYTLLGRDAEKEYAEECRPRTVINGNGANAITDGNAMAKELNYEVEGEIVEVEKGQMKTGVTEGEIMDSSGEKRPRVCCKL